MADRIKTVGVTASYNKEKARTVIPPDKSSAITSRLDRFSVSTGTWSERASMNEPRCGFALHADDDFLYAIGGTDGARVLSSVEEYSVSDDEWTVMTPSPTSRCYFASVNVDGYVYCIGGYSASALGTATLTRKVERYDTVLDQWEELADLPAGYGLAMGVAAHAGGKIYVLSGYKNTINTYLDRVLEYDISANEWTIGTALTGSSLALYGRTLPFAFVDGGHVYVAGGFSYVVPSPVLTDDGRVVSQPPPIAQFLPDSYKFEVSTGEVSGADNAFSDLPKARYGGGTASIDDKHYFVGGINDVSNTLREFESIDAAASPYAYSRLGRLPKGRSSLAVCAYQSEYGDAVFAAGGLASKQAENFLRVEVEAVPSAVSLNGRKSATVRVAVYDENDESPDSVRVRLTAAGDNTVLFAADEVDVVGGFAAATLLPRSDDARGIVTMDDDDARNYDVVISGSIIDSEYYGDTSTAIAPTAPSRIDVGGGGTQFATVKLPAQFEPVKEFDTVISAEQTTPGSYFGATLTDIGGFLSLRPAINDGGRDAVVRFVADVPWLPVVFPVIESNAADYDEIGEALTRLSKELPFGGSPLVDAAVKAADVVDFDVTGAGRVAYFLSDGQNNCSHYTVDDATDKLVAGKVTVVNSLFRVVPESLHLDQGEANGVEDLAAMAKDTEGSTTKVISSDDVSDAINSALKTKGLVGSGVFTCQIDLGEEVVIESITANFDVPDAGTDAFWRYSVGDVNGVFQPMSDRTAADETLSLVDTTGRYVRFVAEFTATLDADEYQPSPIDPPSLTSIDVVYHKKTESYIYFKSTVSAGTPQQVAMTVDANRPSGSEILLGFSGAASETWRDFDPPAAPAIENSGRIVLPIRQTADGSTSTLERLLSVDGFAFDAAYGKWPHDADVVIYRDGSEVVPPSEYSLVPHKGKVVFSYKTSDAYTISITAKPSLNIAAKVVNRTYGSPIVISGAGYMYSTLKARKAALSVVPDASNLIVTPLSADVNSAFRANYTFNDLLGRDELPPSRGGTLISWYVNNEEQSDVKNLQEWDNKEFRLAEAGDVIYFTVEPGTANSGGVIYGRKVRSLPVTVG